MASAMDRRAVLKAGAASLAAVFLPRCHGPVGSGPAPTAPFGGSDTAAGAFDASAATAETAAPAAARSYRLGSQVLAYATFNDLPADHFIAGLALRDANTALITTGSVASPLPHHILTAQLGDSGVTVVNDGTVPFRPVGPAVIHPQNPEAAFVATHDLATAQWGMAQLYGAQVALRGTVAGTYVSGVALSTHDAFPSGLLAVGASAFEGGVFGDDSVTLFDLQRFATSGGQNGTLTLTTAGKNVGGMAEVTINSTPYLLIINAGSISHLGDVSDVGALTLIPLASIADAFAHGTAPAQQTYPLPAGLNLRQGVSIAQTENGPMAILPSAANDGRMYLLSLRELSEREIERRFFNDGVLDLPFITVPDITTGALAYIGVGDVSPDGHWAVATNLNTGRGYLIDIAAQTVVNPTGYLLDPTPLDHREVGVGVWTEPGYVIPVGRDMKLIPYA